MRGRSWKLSSAHISAQKEAAWWAKWERRECRKRWVVQMIGGNEGARMLSLPRVVADYGERTLSERARQSARSRETRPSTAAGCVISAAQPPLAFRAIKAKGLLSTLALSLRAAAKARNSPWATLCWCNLVLCSTGPHSVQLWVFQILFLLLIHFGKILIHWIFWFATFYIIILN